MRKIQEDQRLHYAAGLRIRAIARSLKTSPSTVREYILRAQAQGLTWPLPESLDDEQLERRLLPRVPSMPRETRFPVPAWSTVHRELRRKRVTPALLWQEYKEAHPEGMRYSWFCKLYRAWAAKLDVVVRQEHRVGEKMFVDYAGQTVPVVDRDTGELREAQIFVAVLGASNYTWRCHYNTIRPHGSLGYRPPAPETIVTPSSVAQREPNALTFNLDPSMGAGQEIEQGLVPGAPFY